MQDKIHKLVEHFVAELRAVVAHEILASLEKIVVGVTTSPTVPPKPKTKSSQKKKEYRKAWYINQKLKIGKKLSVEEAKWHKAYLSRK